MCLAQAEEGAGVRKARCTGGAADSAGMLASPHPLWPPPSGCLAGSSAGASLPRPHSSPPDGCRWPAPAFVVAPTQKPSETKSRCSYLALQEAVGDRRSAIWSPGKRPGVGSRRWQGSHGGLGQETNIRACSRGAPPGFFLYHSPTLLVFTDQELVPCFLKFRFSEIAVNRTRVSNGPTRASTAGFHFSNLRLGKLASHTVLPSLRRKGYTGDSLRPWEAPGTAPYRYFTPPKHQKMRLERASQGKWGKAEAAW